MSTKALIDAETGSSCVENEYLSSFLTLYTIRLVPTVYGNASIQLDTALDRFTRVSVRTT